jgi:hypothetical protein
MLGSTFKHFKFRSDFIQPHIILVKHEGVGIPLLLSKFPAPSINFTLLFPVFFVFGESQHFSKSILATTVSGLNTNVLPLADANIITFGNQGSPYFE